MATLHDPASAAAAANEAALRALVDDLNDVPDPEDQLLLGGRVRAEELSGDPAAGLYEDASARLGEHPVVLRLLNLAPVLVLPLAAI